LSIFLFVVMMVNVVALCLSPVIYSEIFEDNNLSDLQIKHILFLSCIPLVAALLYLYKKHGRILSSKPFKKAKFKVGEYVSYTNLLGLVYKGIVTENEKTLRYNEVSIKFDENNEWTVDVNKVRKVSKLENALK
jgi:hypothetical protein